MTRTALLATTFAFYLIGMFALAFVPDVFMLGDIAETAALSSN